MRWIKRYREILLLAVFFIFSFPPFSIPGLPFIMLIPGMMIIEKGIEAQWGIIKHFKVGWFSAFLFSAGTLYWIYNVTWPGLVPLFMAEAVFYGLIFGLTAFLSPSKPAIRCFIFICLWTIMDYLRSKGLIAFPWNPLGATVYYWPLFIQTADIGGVWMIGFWISLVNYFLFFSIKNTLKKRYPVMGLFILLFSLISYGYYKINTLEIKKTPFKAALIQGNVEQHNKWNRDLRVLNFNKYLKMSETAAQEGAKLVFWTETAATCYLSGDYFYQSRIGRLTKKNKISLYTGSLDYRDNKSYNSAFGFDSTGQMIYSYDKIVLVPFGERIPLSDKFPFLNHYNLGQGDFHYGKEYRLAEFEGCRFPTLICYEIIFPDFVRKYVNLGADFIVNLTNDAWFGKAAAPYQHAFLVPFRAVECRIGVLRAANTGFSFSVDPLGKIHHLSELYKDEIIMTRVPLHSETTLYQKFGDWFILFLSLICLAAFIKKQLTFSK